MHRRPFTLVALLALIFIYSIPNTTAFIKCQIQVTNLDYPLTVGVSQRVEVETSLTVTCNTSAVDISGRVDLNDAATNRTLSISGIHVGYVNEPEKTINFTVVNSALAPSSPTVWGLRVHVVLFALGDIVGESIRDIQIQVGQAIVTTTSATATVETTTRQTSEVVTASSIQTGVASNQSGRNIELVWGLIAVVAIISGFLMLSRRRVGGLGTGKGPQVTEVLRKGPPLEPTAQIPQKILPTGYSDLDGVLSGGVPIGYAILIESLPCDEKDLLIRRVINSAKSLGFSVFFVSHQIGLSEDFARRYPDNFFAFCTMTDKVQAPPHNMFKVADEKNLNDLNITIDKAMQSVGTKLAGSKIMIIDLLSDVLLEHGAVVTRKWLEDFLARRRAEGFTIFGTLNPNIASRQQIQTILDLFDGIIEIYEKEIRERSRRFLIVKKMYGLRYSESEILLDKERLF